MKILLFGATGQLGSAIFKLLDSEPFVQLYSLDSKTCNFENFVELNFCINSYSPNIVINAAAYALVDDAEKNPEYVNIVNHLAVAEIAKASARTGAIFIHFSTDYVFSGNSSKPYLELDTASPLNVYGQTKLSSEQAVIRYNAFHIIIRTSWLFDKHGNNFYTKISSLLMREKKLHIVSDQIGGPTYIGDLVEVVRRIVQTFLAGETIPWGIYHYSAHESTSWYCFAQAIKSGLYAHGGGADLIPVLSADYPSVACRPLYSFLSSVKVQKTLGLDPSNWIFALNKLAQKAT